MSPKLFSIALLASLLPGAVQAGTQRISLDRGDFLSASRVSRHGETVLRVKLSKSGKAKLRRLNQEAVGEKVHAEIAGVATDFRLREPITGPSLEMGPYTEEDAARVLSVFHQP